MASDTMALLQVMQTKGIGPRSLARLLDCLERDDISLRDLVSLPADEVVARFGLTDAQAQGIQGNEDTALQLAEALEEHGVRTVRRGSPQYPERLTAVLADKAPPVLFLAGSFDLVHKRGVGFCGARDASDSALRSAELLARAVAEQGLLVVSGHAPGADETVHRAALQAGGATAFVLPEGILHFRARASLADLLGEDQFVVVSEFPPKLPWSVSNAMQRNRTICGLVHAMIVVEAGTSGGTWEAGVEALKLGVPLVVLDFDAPAPSGKGNPLLIRKGGIPLPCRPGELPDLSPLREALDATAAKPAPSLLF